MSFIMGNDVSSFQGEFDWDTYAKNTDFVIVKASEGVGFIDPLFGLNRFNARQYNVLRGWYHFAHPDLGNSAANEATFFCDLIDEDPIQEGELVALDYEVNFNDPVNWCKQWLDSVSSHFNGLKPLIYLNQSLVQTYDWSPVINADYGLWIASYTGDPNNNTANIGQWPFAAMQQWTDAQHVPGISGNVDGDVFFGDSNAFQQYGYHTQIEMP